MTAYQNFIQDFPVRCRTMLNDYATRAERRDLDVTLLLTRSTAGLIIPYERLRSKNADHIADDRTDDLVDVVKHLELHSFAEWASGNSWRTRFSVPRDEIRSSSIDGWTARGKMDRLDAAIPIGTILPILRNDLAHGAMFIESGSRRNPDALCSLVFVADPWEKRKQGIPRPPLTYDVVACSLSDLTKMLLIWIGFLEHLQLPPQRQHVQHQVP